MLPRRLLLPPKGRSRIFHWLAFLAILSVTVRQVSRVTVIAPTLLSTDAAVPGYHQVQDTVSTTVFEEAAYGHAFSPPAGASREEDAATRPNGAELSSSSGSPHNTDHLMTSPTASSNRQSTWIQLTSGCPSASAGMTDRVVLTFPNDPADVRHVSGLMERTLSHAISDQYFTQRNCSATHQVQIIPKCPFWELQALDQDGAQKGVGGDEFYVTYTDNYHSMANAASPNDSHTTALSSRRQPQQDHHPTAVAVVTDLDNGRYRLEFTTSPFRRRDPCHSRLLGHGMLSVVLQYTCGLGKVDQPLKNDRGQWREGGSSVAVYVQQNVTAPPLTPFLPPSIIHTTHGGRRRNNNKNNNSFPIDLGRYSTIIPLGDSILQNFMEPLDVVRPPPNIGRPLNSTTLPRWIEFLETKYYQEAFRKAASAKDEVNNKSRETNQTTGGAVVVMVISTSAWDLLEMDNSGGWDDHAAAMKALIQHIRQRYHRIIDEVIWKSPTAMHIHVPMLQVVAGKHQKLENHYMGALRSSETSTQRKQRFLDRMRYMSASRSWKLYQVQQQVAADLQMPFLDVYQATYLSADHTFLGDGRHYLPELNVMMTNWFVSSSFPLASATVPEKIWATFQERMFELDAGQPLSPKKGRRPKGVLIPASCDTLVGLVNAVLVALVTQRDLLWTTDPDGLARTCSIQLSLPEKDHGGRLQIFKDWKQSNPENYVLVLNHTKQIVTLKTLATEGYIRLYDQSPSTRLAKDLFSEQPQEEPSLRSNLYGMILTGLLVQGDNMVPFRNESFGIVESTFRGLKPYDSLVLAVHDQRQTTPTENKPDLYPCFSKLLSRHPRSEANLACHVLFSSAIDAEEWKSVLQDDFQCIALVLPAGTSNATSFHDATQSFDHLPLVASTAYDGYILPCNSEGKLTLSMIEYLRSRQARDRGTYPVVNLASCCWS